MSDVVNLLNYRHARSREPSTRNQELLNEIEAIWAARPAEERLNAEIAGMEETILANLRQYEKLLKQRDAYEKGLAQSAARSKPREKGRGLER